MQFHVLQAMCTFKNLFDLIGSFGSLTLYQFHRLNKYDKRLLSLLVCVCNAS